MFKYIHFLILPLLLFAEDDLSSLLNTYESQSQLHKKTKASCENAGCIRLYINDQEMSSAITGSALMTFGGYDLGNSALKFGNEYGFVTIYGSNDSYGLGIFHAGITDDNLNYLLYANKKTINKGKIQNQGYPVTRYSESENVYFNIKKKNDFSVELSSVDNHHDSLAGLGMQKTPLTSYLDTSYRYIALTKYFKDLKLQASYVLETKQIDNKDDSGIRLYDGTIVQSFQGYFENTIAKVSLEHNVIFGNTNLLYGIDGLDISSAFLEYTYHFNENNLFVATGKREHYKHQGYDRVDLVFMEVGSINV